MKLLILCLCLCVLTMAAMAGDKSEAEFKDFAAFISNLDSYVTWPADRKTEGNGKYFVVAVVGDSPLAKSIKDLNKQESSTGKKIKVRMVTPDLIPANAHVVVVADSDDAQMLAVLKKLKGTGTLTVSYDARGAMVNVINEPEKDQGKVHLKYEVDPELAAADGLAMGSKFLEIAEVSKPEEK